jgi:hypothetical protein
MNDNDAPDDSSLDDPTAHVSEQWWLAMVGNLVVWARMRVRAGGTAEIFDCDGRIDVYDSEDTARAALMDAEYRALDGLDDDDASEMGIDLDELEPPHIGSDDEEALRAAMTRRMPSRD